VSEKAYKTARIAELERADGWSPIRQRLGVQAFGVNAWTAHEAGETLIPQHDEVPSRHEELYVVTAGHATFMVGDEEIDAPAGTIVFVPDPAANRGAVARDPGTTVLSVGGDPGAAFQPRSWEMNRDVVELFDAGRHAEAKQLLNDALGQYEDRGAILYNLACAEAQLGETDAAVDHVRAAIADEPSLADHARGDDDLAPIRDDPRFAKAVAGS
jgi:tetratricopeptide (TPR) repeat protein